MECRWPHGGPATFGPAHVERRLDGFHQQVHRLHPIQFFGNRSGVTANEKRLRSLGDQIAASGIDPASDTGHPMGAARWRRHRWSIKRKVATLLMAILGILALFAATSYGYVRYQFDQVAKLPCRACVHVVAGRPYNILVIGSDSRAGDTGRAASSFGSASTVGGQRSDTIKILRIDPGAGTAKVLSIPRDTYVTTSGLAPDSGLSGPEKINAAFNNGPEALIETIQNTFGIPISHWMVIDFTGVIDSVKALGGISLDFNYPVRDNYYGTNESGLQITGTGCQSIDGDVALSLSRSRNYQYFEAGGWHADPGSDLSRIARQNTIIEAMVSKAKVTYDPLTLQALISSLRGNIVIDKNLTLGMIYDLAERYHAFSPSRLETWTLPTVGQSGTPAGDVELVSTAAADNYVGTIRQFLAGPAAPVTTPPLDQYGYPITVPTLPPATTRPPGVNGATGETTSEPPSPTTTTLPSYEPKLC